MTLVHNIAAKLFLFLCEFFVVVITVLVVDAVIGIVVELILKVTHQK